jgi:hypothetical protein
LIPRIDLRALVFVAVALACVVGLASRVVVALGPPVALDPSQSSNFRVGQSIGEATFDGFEDDDVQGLRLRLKQCRAPVIAAPMPLTAVSTSDLADRAYGKLDGYAKVDVYDGRSYADFSRLRRLVARAILALSDTESGYFVRFYAPADCRLSDDAYVAWAKQILNLSVR